MLAAVATAILLLPPAAARTWIDFLQSENIRLEREVAELELDEMERRYRAGLSLPVATRAEDHDTISRKLEQRLLIFDYAYLEGPVRQGRTSPEAFIDLLVRRAKYLEDIERVRNDERIAERLQEMRNRGRSGVVRPLADPAQFPELTRHVRQNLDLWVRKRQAGR